MGFHRLLTDKGGHLRTTRPPVKLHLMMMLLACIAPEEIWPRTEDLRPRLSHDLRPTVQETPWTTQFKRTPHGEDTEGVESKAPCLSPTIPVPRVPPDPSRVQLNRQHPAFFVHNHGTPLEVRSVWRENRTGIGVSLLLRLLQQKHLSPGSMETSSHTVTTVLISRVRIEGQYYQSTLQQHHANHRVPATSPRSTRSRIKASLLPPETPIKTSSPQPYSHRISQ